MYEVNVMIETKDKSKGRGINSSLSRVGCVMLGVLLTQVYACSSRSEVAGGAETERAGRLSLPLTYESESGLYRLSATFEIFEEFADPNGDDPLLTLTSSAPPAAPESQVSAELSPGVYTIVIRHWRLYRAEDDTWVGIDAQPSTTEAQVTITADRTSTVTFGFVTTPTPAKRGGTVVVAFEVIGGALCGNGVIEPGEICDDGLLNGLPDKCRTTCTPPDEPPPPLRVSPDSSVNGSGKSWDDPMPNVQAALDQQSAAGGGEVWVLGGYFGALSEPSGTFLVIPSNVTLRGGFIGIETTAEARDPNYPSTMFSRFEPGGPNVPMFVFSDVSNVLLENIEIEDESGGVSLAIRNSHDVVVRNLTVLTSYRYASALEVAESELRIEQSNIDLVGQYLRATSSDLAIVDTTITGGASVGGVQLQDSRVLLQEVVSEAPFWITGSKVLLNRSIATGAAERGGLIGYSGELTLVGSALLDETTGATPLTADSVFVFDSTFANLTAGASGGTASHAAAIEAVSGEVALTTFYEAVCSEWANGLGGCRSPVLFSDNGSVHNSVVVALEPPPSNPYPRDPYDWFFGNTVQQFANCATFDIDAFTRSESPPDQVLATNHPCIDAGDAEALEASRQRLFERVTEFLSPPFDADLSRYEDPDFWRHSTVRTDTSEDTGAPDPGRHWDVTTP
jgi:hypothetical protein